MPGELEMLEQAARLFGRQADDRSVDPRRLRSVIDLLEGKFASVVRTLTREGDLLGHSPVSWVAENCRMSPSSASDRLCVGREL
ncbi:MAG TPA: hypothetical protein VJT78_03320, partial [Candidatus Dormibacteraeota bacterium]|nr:hypothetical protein [Candidatus Dormibacteraeota bacterium]HKV87007.1 hypothetical protein [Candidatus Dormibacteraeota bacterium]